MGFRDSIWFTVILIYFVPMAVLLVTVFLASSYVDFIPQGDKQTVIGAFLTASSILFGFASLSLRSFLDRIKDLNQKTSDVAKELCDSYRMVKADKQLSSKQLSYKTKIGDYGRESAFGHAGDALGTIAYAYDFVAYTFRWWVKLCKEMLYLVNGTALLILGASVILSLLSYAPVFTDAALRYVIISFILAIPTIVIGWYLSNKHLFVLEETLFNVRQQINGKIEGIFIERDHFF